MDRKTALKILGATENDSLATLLEAYRREKVILDRLTGPDVTPEMQAKITETRAQLEEAWANLQLTPAKAPVTVKAAPAPKPTPTSAPAKVARPGGLTGLKWVMAAVAMFALVGGFIWFRGEQEKKQQAAEVARLREAAPEAVEQARQQLQGLVPLREAAARLKTEAEHAREDASVPVAERTWREERSKFFDAFLARVDPAAGRVDPDGAAAAIEESLQQGDVATAAQAMEQLKAFKVPDEAALATARREAYLNPLAALSATQADYFQLLAVADPDLATEVMANVRQAALAAANTPNPSLEALTPVFVLSNLVPPLDETLVKVRESLPVLNYIENPTAETMPLVDQIVAADAGGKTDEVLKLAAALHERGAKARASLQRIEGAAWLTLAKAARAEGKFDDTARRQQEAGEKLLTAAAGAGDKAAVPLLGRWLYDTKRKDAAIPWLEQAVAAGHNELKGPLLDAYLYSRDDQVRARAYPLLQAAVEAEPKNGAALERLATAIEFGTGVAANPGRALELYRQAAQLGDESAVVDVFRCLVRGVGTREDPAAAFNYIRPLIARKTPALSHDTCAAIYRLAWEKPQTDETYDGYRITLMIRLAQSRPADFGPMALGSARATAAGTSVKQHQLAAEFFRQLADVNVFGAEHFRDVLLTERDCPRCDGRGQVAESRDCEDCGGAGRIGCGQCGGTGYTETLQAQRCPNCNGAGMIYQQTAPYQYRCNRCGGTGQLGMQTVQQRCDRCGGRGKIVCDRCGGRGQLNGTGECPECHGAGKWRWVERDGAIPEFQNG
jgi:TPR repeat protein